MSGAHGSFRLPNPWPTIGWGMLAGVVAVSAVLGFGVLSRYQENGPTLNLWNAICRGLGISADTAPATEPQPALRTPSGVAWTAATLDRIASGNAQHGSFVAMNCTACHGNGGVSVQTEFPTLAGMDATVIYKQLDDYRSGKRVSQVMGAMAQALSAQDSADVAAYFAAQPGGLPALRGYRIPESGRSLRESDPGKRLVYAGDPQRGIPPCSACHGPGGFKLGAPALQGQHADYIERQLGEFAQGSRENDIFEQMRALAKQLTMEEMHALGAFYGTGDSQSTAAHAPP
jgi:cytochrome c553